MGSKKSNGKRCQAIGDEEIVRWQRAEGEGEETAERQSFPGFDAMLDRIDILAGCLTQEPFADERAREACQGHAS